MMARSLFLLPLLALPVAAWADPEPGNWELTVTTQMEGMAQPIGPIAKTQCLTAEDARNPSRVLNPGSGTCEFSNRSESGGTYSFDVSCTGQFPMVGTGKVNYGTQTMSGELDLTAVVSNKKVGVNSRIGGRRLGPCP
ncbi:MAG TPA: DUF3617 family protein [Burkholderiales bacterium]